MTFNRWVEFRKKTLIKQRIKILESFLFRIGFRKTELELVDMELDMIDSQLYSSREIKNHEEI